MVCNKCGAETLAEGAVYCASCGSRLDGKIQCQNCKQFNDGANAFCVFCGTRIDGKTICRNCGELIDGAFCPHCGTAVSAPDEKTEKTEKTKKSVGGDKQKLWNKIFGLVSGGVALLGTVLALIFVFLIGFGLKVTVADNKEIADLSGLLGGLSSKDSASIYYFFRDAYKEINELKTLMTESSVIDLLIGNAYVYTVLCTVLAAVTIGCVVGFAIPAVISYVQYATGKKEKVNSKWAMLSIFSFLGGAAALYAQNYVNVKFVIGEYLVKGAIKLNAATMAGAILCTVFAGIWLVVKLVSYGKEWKNPQFIKKAVCVILSSGLLTAIFIFWQKVTLGFEASMGEEGSFIISLASAGSNEFWVAMLEEMLGNKLLLANEANIMAFYVSNIVMIFASVGGVLCIVGCLQSQTFAAENKKNTGLVCSIVLFAVSVLALVMIIVAKENFQVLLDVANSTSDYVDYADGAQTTVIYKYGVCIAALVLTALNLAVSIVHTVFEKQKANEE